MGVEKTGNDAGSGRLNKNSVNLYRPPALRKIDATLNDDRNDKFAHKRNETKTTNSELIINNQEIIENKVQSNINVTVNRPVRKERRPDRAVYIPRARRSQIIASSQVNDTTNNPITESTTSNISSSSSSFCLATSTNNTDNNKSNSNIKNSNNINSCGISSSSSSIGAAAAATAAGSGGPPTKRNSNRSSSSSSSTLQSTSRSSLSNNTTTNNLTTNTAPNTTTTPAITNIITNLTDIGDSNNYYTNSIIKDNPKRSSSSSSLSLNQNIQNFMISSDIDNSYCDNYKNSPQQLPKHKIITNESNNHNYHLQNTYTTTTTNDISDNCISTQVLNISSMPATTATTTKTELNNDLLSINSSLVEVNNLNNSNTSDIDCDKIYKNNNYSQDYNNYLDNNSFNNYIDTVDCVQSNNFLNNMFTNNIVENDQKQNQIQIQKNNVLRIENAAVIIDQKSINDKDDNKDIEELQRASKEINRSNRCIIKQTFNSDILEIPEPDDIIMKKQKSGNYIQNNKEELYDRKTKDIDPENDDWDSMFDDNGECIDPKIISELTASVGKVKIEIPKNDYKAYHVKHSILNDEEFPHVLEISNFPVEFKTQDLMMIFSTYKESGFDIKWVDDTHALAVFSSSRIAAEVLSKGHPFVILKPLAEATIESRTKAKKCSSSLQPYRPRPETCAALARRLVTGALGVRLKTAAQERENEKRVLKEAKERKLLAAKQRDEVWES